MAGTTDRTKPTCVRFRTDDDGVIRTWPDRPPELPPLMANALAPVDAAHADFQGNTRFLLPARAAKGQEEPVFANIPIDTFAMPMDRSEEHTSELQSLMRTSYAVFCLKKKTQI